jgi:hypothetical protein
LQTLVQTRFRHRSSTVCLPVAMEIPGLAAGMDRQALPAAAAADRPHLQAQNHRPFHHRPFHHRRFRLCSPRTLSVR